MSTYSYMEYLYDNIGGRLILSIIIIKEVDSLPIPNNIRDSGSECLEVK